MVEKQKQVLLVIFDGWGLRDESEHNAIAQAKTPYFDYLWEHYPHAKIAASGLAVGLPDGEMGNSEVGHTIIGAGKVIDTDVVRINKAVEQGELGANRAFQGLFSHVQKHDSTLHVVGLISPGGVHSHQNHLHGFLKAAKKAGISKLVIHAFTDGRDTPPQSANTFLKSLEEELEQLGVGRIASVMGRYYSMDRDNNWDRVERAEKALFESEGTTISGKKASEVVENLHQEGKWDEHLEPMVFIDTEGNHQKISENDGVYFFNFRADRARMISKKIAEHAKAKNLYFVTSTDYDKTIEKVVAFPPQQIETTLAEQLSKAGLTQAHIAETEKYAHVTYFLNGGKETPHENEEHVLIESRKDIKTHDEAPQMRAREIADKTIEFINKGTDFIVINFANPDMVGHTGNMEAAIQALEFVDEQLKRVVEAVLANGGVAFITADHGNAEIMFSHESGQKHTAHTNTPVPGILTLEGVAIHEGGHADIAPTILELLGIEKPEQMTGKSLIQD